MQSHCKLSQLYLLRNWAHLPFKNSKFPFRTPERPTSVHEHHIYEWEKDNSCKQDTLTDITVYIYRFLYRYTVLLYWWTVLLFTQLIYTGHTNTHTDTALYIYNFMHRYTVLLYTSCTDGLYLCLHNCTLLYNLTLPKHTLVVHTLCSDQLYCCTFIL